jgi:hypothetical protein
MKITTPETTAVISATAVVVVIGDGQGRVRIPSPPHPILFPKIGVSKSTLESNSTFPL